MIPRNLNPLPEWDERFHLLDEGELWKWKDDLQAAEAMYNQWRQVFAVVTAFADTLPDGEDESLTTRRFIYENAYIIAPKIISAAGDTLYQIKMENAALIRFNCRQMWEQVAFAVLMNQAEPSYKAAVEREIARFKELFREWVSGFKKDDYEDEWGLF